MKNGIIETVQKNEGKESLWSKELWKQKEVAGYFEVTSGTIKNWRDRGLLSYFQPPGSSRVWYHRDDIEKFIKNNSNSKKVSTKSKTEIKVVKPSTSSKKKDWRI